MTSSLLSCEPSPFKNKWHSCIYLGLNYVRDSVGQINYSKYAINRKADVRFSVVSLHPLALWVMSKMREIHFSVRRFFKALYRIPRNTVICIPLRNKELGLCYLDKLLFMEAKHITSVRKSDKERHQSVNFLDSRCKQQGHNYLNSFYH